MSATSFSNVSTQFSIYAGFSICIFGIIGNLLNIRLLFPTRSNPCPFLLFVSSFFNIIALSEGLLPRILVIAFNIDPSSTSIIWRNRSKLRAAKISIFIAILVIIAINMPFLLFYTIIEVKTGTGNTTTICSLIDPSIIFYISSNDKYLSSRNIINGKDVLSFSTRSVGL
jgi:hypothetical protein